MAADSTVEIALIANATKLIAGFARGQVAAKKSFKDLEKQRKEIRKFARNSAIAFGLPTRTNKFWMAVR